MYNNNYHDNNISTDIDNLINGECHTCELNYQLHKTHYDNKEESRYNKEESIDYDYDSAQPSKCGDDCNNIVIRNIDDKPW